MNLFWFIHQRKSKISLKNNLKMWHEIFISLFDILKHKKNKFETEFALNFSEKSSLSSFCFKQQSQLRSMKKNLNKPMSTAHKFYGNFLLCVFKFSMNGKKNTNHTSRAVESIFGLKFEFLLFAVLASLK